MIERRFPTEFRESASDEPGLVLEDDGTVNVVQPGGARTALPTNGGSQPTTQEKLEATSAQAPPGQGATLTWGHALGDALLDYTDPEAPTVIEAGTFALSMYVFLLGNVSAGTWMEIDAEMDADNDDWDIHNTAPVLPGVDSSRSVVGVAITAKIPAGAKLVATLYTDAVTNTSSLLMRGQIAKLA